MSLIQKWWPERILSAEWANSPADLAYPKPWPSPNALGGMNSAIWRVRMPAAREAYQALPDGEWKLIWRPQDGLKLLFHLKAHPHKQHDLTGAEAHAQTLAVSTPG